MRRTNFMRLTFWSTEGMRLISAGTPVSCLTLVYDFLSKQQQKLIQKHVGTKEAAFKAFYEASDRNRADRHSDTFDDEVRAEFETWWAGQCS